MKKLEFSAGNFEVEAWTGSHPMWLTIRHEGEEIARDIHHQELRDLAYVLDRMRSAMRASMSEQYKHELD